MLQNSQVYRSTHSNTDQAQRAPQPPPLPIIGRFSPHRFKVHPQLPSEGGRGAATAEKASQRVPEPLTAQAHEHRRRRTRGAGRRRHCRCMRPPLQLLLPQARLTVSQRQRVNPAGAGGVRQDSRAGAGAGRGGGGGRQGGKGWQGCGVRYRWNPASPGDRPEIAGVTKHLKHDKSGSSASSSSLPAARSASRAAFNRTASIKRKRNGCISMLRYWSSLRYSSLRTLFLLAADLRLLLAADLRRQPTHAAFGPRPED